MSAIIVKSFVGQAEAYFEKELTNERETYYSEKGTRAGQWTGKGAEALGLTGEIKKEDFSRMSRGINPTNGERFRRMTLGRTREVNGEIKQVKEIAGWDMVISAPKSVSIAGLIGQDECVRTAHQESVTDALDRAERQAQSNNGGGKKEQTNNLVVGRFSHDSARPSRGGFVAPQLHDHCFIMNATLRADGTLKPLESLELHKAQNYIKSVYYTGLADRLQKLGYAVEIEKETGAPEITGISKQYRQACSPRRAEILELAKKAGRNFRQLGLVNRREKIFDKNLIQEQHRDIDKVFGNQAKQAVEMARITPVPTGKPDFAKEAVTFALSKLSERESVFNPRVVLLEANKRGIGQTSVAAIEAELETRKKDGQVKTVRLRDGREAAFLSSDAQIENELPQHIKAVQPTDTLLNEILKTKIPDSVKADDEIEFRKLSDEQQKAVRDILTAKTGVVTLEGRAGVGKTTTLSFVNKIAEKADYEVLGLAPTTGAAQELDNAKITSSTLQKLLASQDAPRDHKRFFIVDESSFVSSRQMDKFFREAVKPNDRVLLVGDTRQHEGVEAGKPFARIQRDELTSGAKVETIRRQTKESDRETVKKLSEGRIIEAVGEMRERGQVREIRDRAERHNSIVEAFLADPEKTTVVAPRNADRQEINSKIHEALKDAGKIGREETEAKILRPRNDISGVEREFAAAYREGDVISYTRGSAENKIAAKSLAKVVKTDREQNLLTVEIKDSRDGTEAREITYNPKRLRGVSVWMEEKIKVSEGDRLQLRTPFEEKKTKIANGTMLEVSQITPEAITLRGDKGEAVKLDTSEPHAIDYGYAVTSYSSQGKTIDRVLIHAETSESKQILNERMAYVAVSRARDEALIFTDDAEKLAEKMARQVEKSEITLAMPKTIEYAPQVSEIKPPVVLPGVEKSPTPEIKIQPTQEKNVAADVKPEVAPIEREEIEIQPARKETVILDAKPEVERGEIKPPVIPPEPPVLPTAEIKAQPPQQKTTGGAIDAKYSQETLIKEVLQMSRDSLAKQGINPDPQAWERFANVVISDSPNRKPSENQERLLESLQKDAPQPERINLAGKTSLEATHAILTSAPEKRRDEIVKATLASYEKQIAAERGEIEQPVILPEEQTLPTADVKPQQLGEKAADGTGDAKNRLEILVIEVLQMSLDSLSEQGIALDPQVWKRFATDIINNAAHQKSTERQQKALELLQKDVPQPGRVGSAGKSRLEAAHAMLKLATEEQRDEIVKNTLANYERQIKTERGEAVAKPEVKETAETTSFEKAEKAAVEQVKPTPKVRDLEVAGREKLISELVTAARDEARAWTGKDLSYQHEKRLTKMYRETGDIKPREKQINDLKAIEARLSEPLPQPKTYLEATVLKFDNMTDAEKSAALRGQIADLNEVVKGEELQKAESARTAGRTDKYDMFGRTDEYFIQESHRAGIKPKGRTSFSLISEAYDRGLIVKSEIHELDQQKRIQTGLYQMGIANAFQEQIKKSLDEQGIKLEPAAQRIVDKTVDGLLKQPLTDELIKRVEDINQSRGSGIKPETTLEATAYLYTHSNEEKRDKWSSALASTASQKAIETERIKSKEMENLRDENKTQFFTR